MSMLHYATESMAYMVAGMMDQGHKDYQAPKIYWKHIKFISSLKQLFQKYFPLKLPGMLLMRPYR